MIPQFKVFLFLIVIICATTYTAFAASIQYDVNPNNITEQRLKLKVEYETKTHNTYWFRIYVSDGESSVSAHRTGRLEVKQSGAIVFACDVQERSVDDRLQFLFGVNLSFLDDATFSFSNFDPSGMPSADIYKLNLDDFVEH